MILLRKLKLCKLLSTFIAQELKNYGPRRTFKLQTTCLKKPILNYNQALNLIMTSYLLFLTLSQFLFT